MGTMQKVFLLGMLLYLTVKLVFGFILYIITKRVEEKALVQKKQREHLVRIRRDKSMELYRKQYLKARQRKDSRVPVLA